MYYNVCLIAYLNPHESERDVKLADNKTSSLR